MAFKGAVSSGKPSLPRALPSAHVSISMLRLWCPQWVALHLQGEGRALHCQHGHLCGQGLSNQGSPAQSLPRGVAMLLLSLRAASYFLASE